MDYEKAYKEALGRAKEEMSKQGMKNDVMANHLVGVIFPELKESEDEAIRKKLLKLFNDMERDDSILDDYGLDKLKTIKWLEKQGQFFTKKDVDDAWLKGMCDAKHELEKQSVQKQDPCEHCEEVMLNCHNFPCIKKRVFKQGKTALEAIKDVTVDNANKVEPKFNVGDWLLFATFYGARPWLVTAVTSDSYVLQNIQGYDMKPYHEIVENHYRLWTLKDAKSGDVLITEDDKRPFIFKEFLGYAPSAYCGIDTTNSIYIGTDDPWTRNPVRPATYEERQLLFNKLEEEGYKWDAESLTISKIQKRWKDKEDAEVNGYYIHSDSFIIKHSGYNNNINHNVFATKKQAKSALAMARISQIMANDKRFGGAITDEEWNNATIYAVIVKSDNKLFVTTSHRYEYLAFHEREQAKLFLEENEDLIRDYYMMD